MRDCLIINYVQGLGVSNLHPAAVRLANDLRRRGIAEDMATRMIVGLAQMKIVVLKPAHITTIERAVTYVYRKQEHLLTCTGRLKAEGLCFKTIRPCRFDQEDQEIRSGRRSATTVAIPDVGKYLPGANHADVLYATLAYTELAKVEAERNLIPGDAAEPILIGFRGLAARVVTEHQRPGFDRNVACTVIRLLEDVGLIKRVVQGRSGRMNRQANGYIRVLPPPPVPDQAMRSTAPKQNALPLETPKAPRWPRRKSPSATSPSSPASSEVIPVSPIGEALESADTTPASPADSGIDQNSQPPPGDRSVGPEGAPGPSEREDDTDTQPQGDQPHSTHKEPRVSDSGHIYESEEVLADTRPGGEIAPSESEEIHEKPHKPRFRWPE